MSAGDAIRSGASRTAGLVGEGFGINQTSFMFGALVVSFIFYVTIKGDLPQWLGLLGLGGFATASTTTNATGPAAGTSLTSGSLTAPGSFASGGNGSLSQGASPSNDLYTPASGQSGYIDSGAWDT